MQTPPPTPRPGSQGQGSVPAVARPDSRGRKPSARARLVRALTRPSLPTKVALGAVLAAAAYASFQGFSGTYAQDGAPELRPVFGGAFALSVFACGWIMSRRSPRRFD